jgi:ubiquinone/menaquinone biosynthesis C-methylase UbiE
MNDTFEKVAAAFSRKALVYDAFGQDHPNLTRMREQVYRHLLDYARPPARILELNAGTGSDALFLAQAGFHVHATDLAPGMLAQIERKIAQHNLQNRMTAQQCSFTELEKISAPPFDVIFSNFGGLNCIPNLHIVTRTLPHLLNHDGIVTWVVMPPICLWDFAALAKGDWRTATRRWSRNGILANVEGVRFMTYYFSPAQVASAFGKNFRVLRVQGLSIFAPPADRKNFAHRFPRLYRWLVALDNRVCDAYPLRGWGDFFIITLRYSTE